MVKASQVVSLKVSDEREWGKDKTFGSKGDGDGEEGIGG